VLGTTQSCLPFFNYSAGVRQGDPSSPLLAMFFVNDLINSIYSDLSGTIDFEDVKLFLLVYADDMVLFSKSPSMLKYVENYCNTVNSTVPGQ